MDNRSIRELRDSLNTHLDLPAADPGDLPESALEFLRQALAQRLLEMLEEDFSRLLQLLYRIDVDEARLRSSIDGKTGEDASLIMADAIIARQLEKLESRRKHRDSGQEGWLPVDPPEA